VPDNQALLVKGIFQREYGVFDYGKLPKTTYYQTFAQMYRKREDAQGRPRGVSAPFYEKVYIPNFRPGERILDFGCGQADYVRLLQKQGVRIWGMEFYFRAKQTINTIAVHQMADSLFASLQGDGRFDTVLCEFVLNSTDSLEAEAAVMTCLNALCKKGGRIYASGRTTKSIDDEMKATSKNQYALAFLDKNGYSARAVRGNWLYQKYHTVAEATALAKKYIGADAQYVELAGAPNTFLITGTKQHELPDDQVRHALEFEFNLMWPDGQYVNKHAGAIAAWEAARAKE
jgi:2-polyprenyl-3-methyl-5-hydroxy-6-metoxy-1,4-benzoquinol methylase